MRKPPRPARQKPHFIWQGALIVLPALLLAGACLYSLKQDRVLAEHDLSEQAQRLAKVLAQEAMPRLFKFELAEEVNREPLSSPEQDPIARILRSPLVRSACLVGDEGELVYPPALGRIPTPTPLDLGELNPEQQDGWLALEESRARAVDVTEALERFSASRPPERVLAVARLRTAAALHAAGHHADAIQLMILLREAPASLVGESGVPIANLADFQLIHWLGQGRHDESANRLCSRLTATASPMSEAFWARLPASPIVSRWLAVKASHEGSRLLHATAISAPGETFVTMEGESLWRLERWAAAGRWVIAVPLEALKLATAELERSLLKPEHLSVAIALGSYRLTERPADRPLLAADAAADLPIAVEVFLTDPAAFEAQYRSRSARFASLVALSVVAVVIGFWSAWRSFRREQQLSEMKTNFVSSVSHELRAPIASVRLMAEELEHGESPSQQKLQQYHRFIAQECRRLTAVIENVLDFARSEQGREKFEFEATDLEALVGETVALLRAYAAEREITLEEVHLGNSEEVEADGHALQRALINLLDNAIKHSPRGSTVTVGLEFAREQIFLYVEDRGRGIPHQERERVFERFYRIGSELRRETQGIGLGLSIVKRLAEVHGGRVLLRSEVGAGSRFTIELPLKRSTLPVLLGSSE